MAWRVRYHPAFVSDVRSAIRWYEKQQRHLGQRFADRVTEGLDTIADSPESCPAADLKVLWLRPFPYGIYFEIVGSEVFVIAARQLHRRPGTFVKRRRS
ncbi:MAG: type II toxin-antitoxin system RelE/ParE family toxin [Planctomycetaceae bacterium]|nr:type II toxin-antitoxin system RelE/ParE family toxin [Planctomycetaceae bacterium]